MEFFIVAALIGCIPAAIAHNKGRSFFGWWLYGAALFIVALPHALVIRGDLSGVDRRCAADGLVPCDHCAEFIRPNAKVCRYCGRDVAPETGLNPATG